MYYVQLLGVTMCRPRPCECLCAGVVGVITTAPKNTLVVRCKDDYANMTCVSTANDEIAWTYDGNTVINAPCQANTGAFLAERQSANECNMRASLANATNDPNIRTISGPYGCTDQSNNGTTEMVMAVVIGKLLF